MLALAVVALTGLVLAVAAMGAHRWLGRGGPAARWERRLATATLSAAVLVIVLAVVVGPVRWQAVAEDAPKGPGGRSSLRTDVEGDEAVQRELAQRELAQVTGRLPSVVLHDVTVEGRLTGPDAVNDTARRWNVHATDLGHLIDDGRRLRLVFGDTFGRGGLGGRDWRSNVMASVAPGQADRLRFGAMVTDERGHAAELLSSQKVDGVEKTVIPTNGIADGGRLYLHYMSVRTWKGPGRWIVNHAGLASSDDGGATWTEHGSPRWSGDGGFAQVAFVRHDGWIHLFGIPEGRYGPARLARVRPGQLLDADAYAYWDGSGWVADPSRAATVVPGPVGELSVAWSATFRTWLMLYLDEQRQAIVLRTARQLTGPWSQAELVVSAADVPTLYGPFIVPGSLRDGRVAFTLSRYDRYNVYLVRASLRRQAAPAPPPP